MIRFGVCLIGIAAWWEVFITILVFVWSGLEKNPVKAANLAERFKWQICYGMIAAAWLVFAHGGFRI